MDEKLTIKEALDAFPENPNAAALALGMVLLQNSSEHTHNINTSIIQGLEKQVDELEEELYYWKSLGKKWLALKSLLAEPQYEQ